MTTSYILLGSNMGDRLGYLQEAREQIKAACGQVYSQSAIYETAPWGMEGGQAFLNAVLAVETALPAASLLTKTQAIEHKLQRIRQRALGYQPRTLDIDLLFYGDTVQTEARLTLPHPRLHQRRFTLVPLAEIAPQHWHPGQGQTIAQLLAACQDPLGVELYQRW